MASQEEFELSRLLDHRLPADDARAGATILRGVHISTTDQASGPAEAEFAQRSSSDDPGSSHITQNASVITSSSNDNLPLSPKEDEDVRTTRVKQRATVPWPLRRGPLLGLVAYLVALITALEVVYFLSNRNQGLVTTKQDTSYLWKYLPTAILTILAFYWNKLDYHTRAIMPWKLMSQKPQSADQSLLMDYVSGNLLAVVTGSIRYRHVPVITSTVGSLTLILVIIASTGLFILQPTLIHEETAISVLSTFDGTLFNSSEVDSFSILAVSSIISGNSSISYPPNTNKDHAVDNFRLQTALDGPDASKSGSVEAYHANLDCKNGSVKSMSATAGPYDWEIEVDMFDDDCVTGPTLVAAPTEMVTEASNFMSIGGIFLKQCPSIDQPRLFIFFGQLNVSAPYNKTGYRHTVIHSFDSTVLLCTPRHALQEALVTTDSVGTLIDVEVQKTSEKNVTSPWNLWAAFNTSLRAAAPTFLEGSYVRQYSHGGFSYDDFFAVLLATWSRQPAEYLNPGTLMLDSQRLYTTTASQIANRYLRTKSTRVTSGSYKTSRLRVILTDTALRSTEAGLVILIICACLVVLSSPCPSTSNTGTTLASLAVLIHISDRLKLRLCGSGEASLDHIKESLSGQSFSTNGKSNSIQLQGSGATNPASSVTSTSAAGTPTWWRPVVFTIYMKIAVLTLPLAIIACLEATYQISRKKSGLCDAPSNHYWHYAGAWIPASTMTLVRLMYASLTWSVALLDPYIILRTSSVAAQHIYQVNLSKASVQLICQSVKTKRYSLLVTSVTAILAPLLTIIVSGLVFAQPTPRTEDIVIPLADHISSPSGQYLTIAAWSQASLCAANLLYQGYGSYPKGTYQSFIFPNLMQGSNTSILPVGAKLLNASSIDVNVGVVLSNITCRVMDPAGFRYTVGFNGSNDPTDTTPEGVWYGGSPGDSYLNLTHTEFAGYRCEDPGPHCGDQILSLGIELEANSTRFSSQVYDDSLLHTWTDPSAYPDDDTLRQAIATRNETAYVAPNLTLLYGNWDATSAQIRGMACYYDVRQGMADVTHDLSTNTITSVQPSKQGFAVLSNFSQALPWTGAYQQHLNGLLPNGDLWRTAINNTPEAFYDTPTGSAQLATQVSELYNHFFTQFYNTALRDQNFTADTTNATATLHDPNFQRIFQSAISTRILEALLLAMWLCACIVYYLCDTKTLLPKNPCSIAAQASLLADSKFLDMIPDGAENATLGELMQMTPFKDHLFSMGWWDDGNGGRRFGVDVGMADFDKGEDEAEKMEGGGESGEIGKGVGDVGDRLVGKVDARVSVDIVGSRV